MIVIQRCLNFKLSHSERESLHVQGSPNEYEEMDIFMIENVYFIIFQFSIN